MFISFASTLKMCHCGALINCFVLLTVEFCNGESSWLAESYTVHNALLLAPG